MTAFADREVILSGGAINSPQLLMLSGIGPEQQLKNVGIPVHHHLSGVGQNLQDHATVILKYACTQPVTIHQLANPVHKAIAGMRWLANRSGPATSNVWEAGGLVRSNPDVNYPNIQYHFAPVGVEYDEANRIKLDQAFSIHIDQSRPTSRGSVELKSADPEQKPRIQFNYLSTEHDRRVLIEGVKCARDLIAQPAFDAFRGKEVYPGADVVSEKSVHKFLRQFGDTDFHPSCTCRMGNDGQSVVDSELRVHGVEGLRVVDASVMPQITSANLNAPTQMIAARAADFILGNPQLAPEFPGYSFD
ncbi:MAG: choline dehydrogenase [Gammaproteobacteria bacterium]|jgi:choline dehydrogenase